MCQADTLGYSADHIACSVRCGIELNIRRADISCHNLDVVISSRIAAVGSNSIDLAVAVFGLVGGGVGL